MMSLRLTAFDGLCCLVCCVRVRASERVRGRIARAAWRAACECAGSA